MIFNSVTYLLFLALVLALYWTLPRTPRLYMIFGASILFYGFWRFEFVPVMLASAVTDYFAALGISHTDRPARRKIWLASSLVVNLGLLFYFKYLMFFADNAVGLANAFGLKVASPALDIILPLGISFYTFQTISYTVDVYRGFIKPERNFILYGCYVTFFPQLVAGPVLRAREVVPQLFQRPSFKWLDVGVGSRRILYGLFLKVVLADNIAPLVDAGFDQSLNSLGAIDVLTLAYLFGFQIYFDFCAYSHIALGSARIMGIHFPENFNFPYIASTPKDFWQRWHISLSSWIRDYLYLPLTGASVQDRSSGGLAGAVDDVRPKNKNRALFMTWGIMGLWHGANWTFVLWGLYHATLIACHRIINRRVSRLPERVRRYGGWAIMLPLAMISWIPFRAASVGDAMRLMWKLLQPAQYFSLGLRENNYLVAAAMLAGVLVTYGTQKHVLPRIRRNAALALVLETALFTVLIAAVFVFLRPIQQFIYFQF